MNCYHLVAPLSMPGIASFIAFSVNEQSMNKKRVRIPRRALFHSFVFAHPAAFPHSPSISEAIMK